MSEYFLRFDPEEIEAEEKLKIESYLKEHKNLSYEQFKEVIGNHTEYDYNTYLNSLL